MVEEENIKNKIGKLVELKRESREHNTTIVNDDLVNYANGIADEIKSMLGSFPDDKTQDFKKLDEFFLNILNSNDIRL